MNWKDIKSTYEYENVIMFTDETDIDGRENSARSCYSSLGHRRESCRKGLSASDSCA